MSSHPPCNPFLSLPYPTRPSCPSERCWSGVRCAGSTVQVRNARCVEYGQKYSHWPSRMSGSHGGLVASYTLPEIVPNFNVMVLFNTDMICFDNETLNDKWWYIMHKLFVKLDYYKCRFLWCFVRFALELYFWLHYLHGNVNPSCAALLCRARFPFDVAWWPHTSQLYFAFLS